MKRIPAIGVPPRKWGAKVRPRPRTILPWAPQKNLVHWGGGGGGDGYNIDTPEAERAGLQGWERNHLARGFDAIGYNYIVGQTGTLYRGRGENRSGAQFGNPNSYCRAFVFLTGPLDAGGEELPTDAALRAFSIAHLYDPLPVGVHSDVYPTSCPGHWLRAFVNRAGWIDYWPTIRTGDKGEAVRALRWRLRTLGYKGLWRPTGRRRFTGKVARAVRDYQESQSLVVDGIVGPITYQHLTDTN